MSLDIIARKRKTMNKMTVDELRASGRIIYDVIAGSHLYGTNIESSDVDTRGYFFTSKNDYISLFEVQDQVNDEKNDVVYYDLKRAFNLLKTANPNQIELIFPPKNCDCVKYKHPIMDILFENRHLFISKKAYFTHSEYAHMQVKKSRGANKKVHNPQPETMPRKEDFCWYIDVGDRDNEYDESELWFSNIRKFCRMFKNRREESFPFRPKPLKHTGVNLAEYHVTSLEHTPNVFRLYHYGKEAKGVFRGDQYLACESIPKEDENEKFRGILIYNHPEFERAVKDWHSYWDFMKNRNISRWTDQEKGLVDFDAKNISHCVRLLISAENIMTNGESLVRLEGENKKYVMDIRYGKFTYDGIMKDVDERKIRLEELFKKSTLPEEADIDKLNKLYKKMMDVGEESMKGKI